MPATPDGAGKLVPPERNHFFYGKLMDAGEFQKDQSYFNHKRSLVNRFVLGSGVVCGLNVGEHAASAATIRIEPGLAVDPSGREIVVAAPVTVDARQLTDDRGEAAGTPIESGAVEIRLAYAERKADHVPVLVADCDTPGGAAPATIREGFRVLVRQAPDEIPSPPACAFPELRSPPSDKPLHQFIHEMLCARTQGGAGEPAEDESVPIARVTLADSGIESIDLTAGRQLVYGNALLYELILCLAEQVHALSNRT
jgi:hypothetical protein